MLDSLCRLLDYLSQILDAQRQAQIGLRFLRSLEFKTLDRPPCVHMGPLPAGLPFELFPRDQMLVDPEKMLFNELLYAFDTSIAARDRVSDDLPLTVRANFGTVLIASMFGAPVEQMGDNPPWVHQKNGKHLTLADVAAADPRDMHQGWIPRVLETMECYHDLLARWPEVRRLVRVVLPDLQGPFDNLELICGSEVFLQMVTEPARVAAALDGLASAQIEVAKHLMPQTNDEPRGFCHQHAVQLKGNILLRNDSCVMVSAEMYREQIAPHDEKVLHALGGGGVHSCGNFGHLVDEYLALPSLLSLDFGQSEKNDVESIYERARARNIALIRIAMSEEAIAGGQAAEHFPTGVVFIRRQDPNGRASVDTVRSNRNGND